MKRHTPNSSSLGIWQVTASATAILFSSLMYWILHVRPLTSSSGFSWRSFRDYFPYDQYSYLAIAVNVEHGNIAAVEPFTETGINHYPRLYYVFLGLVSRFFHTDIIATWQMAGLGFQFLMVAAISWLLIRLTGLPIFGFLGFVPSIVGTFAVAAGGVWYHSLDNHAVLWGAFGVLFTLNGESAALSIAVSAICLLIGITFPSEDNRMSQGSRGRTAAVIFVAAAVGMLANVQTYSFLTAVYLLVYVTAAYGLLTFGWRKRLVALSVVLLVAVLLGGTVLAAATGPLLTLVVGLLPAAPGFFLVLLRYKSTVILACASVALAASPTVIGTLLGLVEKDDFLTYREVSSTGLGVPLGIGILAALVPLLMLAAIFWAGVAQANNKWTAFSVGVVIAWPLVASNDLWGANQEPYRFWIDSFAIVTAAAVPVASQVAVRSWRLWQGQNQQPVRALIGLCKPSSGLTRSKSRLAVAVGMVALSAFALSLADYSRFSDYVHDKGTVSFNDAQAVAIKSAAEKLTSMESDLRISVDETGKASELVMSDPCVSPFRLKTLTGLPTAFYNLGLAWPENESEIRELLAEHSKGSFAQRVAQEANVNYVLTDTRCPENWQGKIQGAKVSEVVYDNNGTKATLTLWKLNY